MARQLRRSGLGTMAPPASHRPIPRQMLRPDMGGRGRGITQFLGEVRSEIRKVVWPTRQEAIKLTSLVIAMSVAMGFLLGAIDYAFAELFRWVLTK